MTNDYSSRFQHFRGQPIIGLVGFSTLVQWNLFVNASGAWNAFVGEGDTSSARLTRTLSVVLKLEIYRSS